MKGRAAVSTGPGFPFELREYEARPPAPGEILVRVTMAGICGSDLHIWRGEMGAPKGTKLPPSIWGHEMCGRVEALGAGRVSDMLGQPLREGDRVAYAYFTPCGACWACLTGQVACPNRYRARGSADDSPHFTGAYGQYYYLQPGQWVFKVPDELPDEMVAPVNCALSEVIYGLHQVGVWFGDSVVVQGAGGLGIYACAVAKDMGAAKVIAIDGIAARLALARRFGADDTIDLNEYDTPAARIGRVYELTGGAGADVAVEVVGYPQVVPEGVSMLRPGGRYLLHGNITPGAKTDFVPHDVVRPARTLVGVAVYDAWVIPRALEWMVRRRDVYPFGELVSHVFPLDRIDEAFEQADWAAKAGRVLRAAIAP